MNERIETQEELKLKVTTVHATNYGVYGAREVWLTLNREAPLMRRRSRAAQWRD